MYYFIYPSTIRLICQLTATVLFQDSGRGCIFSNEQFKCFSNCALPFDPVSGLDAGRLGRRRRGQIGFVHERCADRMAHCGFGKHFIKLSCGTPPFFVSDRPRQSHVYIDTKPGLQSPSFGVLLNVFV